MLGIAYANPAMLGLFGLTAEEMLGRTFAALDYPPDVAELLNSHIDQIFAEGVTVENEVFYRSPTGYAAHFAYLWGPVRGESVPVRRSFAALPLTAATSSGSAIR